MVHIIYRGVCYQWKKRAARKTEHDNKSKNYVAI